MAEDIAVERLVRVYLKMRATHAELLADFKKRDDELKANMAKVKAALLGYCKEHGVESVRTESGLFYRTVKKRFSTNDWESFGKFVIEHGATDLYEKRLHQENTKQFLEEHPELLPPGLNVDSEYSITVKKNG